MTEVDSYDWIAFLPMADGSGAYNRYFGRMDTGKMKIRGVMARKRAHLSAYLGEVAFLLRGSQKRIGFSLYRGLKLSRRKQLFL